MEDMQNLSNLSGKTPEEIFRYLRTSPKGLSSQEASKRLKFFGPNRLLGEKKLAPFLVFLSKFRNPLLILLIVAAIVSGFLGSEINALIILIIVFGSTFIDFLNTYKSGRAAEALKERVNITASVWRNGEIKERRIQDIVPGDIFSLVAGDLVPADGVLFDGKDLFVNESILTGESLPKEKDIVSEENRIVYMGTSVVSGTGSVIAARTGSKARMGEIAGKLTKSPPPTEFEKNIKDFSLFIFKLAIFLVLVIIFLNIFFERKPPLEIFLFAVAIAVGLTPELLPMIITANLAKGALRMSEGGVIVKRLSAIHNFGSIDVFCTDKTGTLTEDKISLIKHVDGLGRDSSEVLFWGYLASINTTSVRGTLERAVEEVKNIPDIKNWEKVDEIPFDSERKRDSVVMRDGSKIALIAKGAPEEIFKISQFYGEEDSALNGDLLERIDDEYKSLSSDGFRVLGVAIKTVTKRGPVYSVADETGMTFLGFLAFLDPAKKTAKDTIQKMLAHNVDIKIITGDNRLVSEKIARDIGFEIKGVLDGPELQALDYPELRKKVETTNLFSRVVPEQKQIIIKALRENGHVVGYLGDGVNDALPLREADVGVSVNNAVDIAKDTADIILLHKGLSEIIEGVVEGRKTFANTFKYLMMALSSNFGNMFSMPIASLFVSFLPMTPSQILLNNFLYDGSQLAIPFDNVEESFLKRPKKFNLEFMKKFMFIFGPLSSCFDLLTFMVLLYGFDLIGSGFQTGWFLESIATQALVVGVIRNREGLLKTKPSKLLVAAVVGVVAFAWLLPYMSIGHLFDFIIAAPKVLISLASIVTLYLFAVQVAKKYFYRKYGYLIEAGKR
ncbi:MAG: magnesium-translocating P-type ATPase [Patescibacteria group bacterium]|nr:magnesium-translocating P-type ATPase [Patescibacteria group bacterium]MDE2015804.1 magnesium-translocating P-type ATPase [Patescibacteria group bacterium]MDE2227179.1 magnesium-translocating P-type ATPase [Patescibacteria group bacterium]